ncbi:hypothetical protein E4T66_04900 [Sinimarinibacterium sp. CAU 1509]|uniref:CsiV family protein n=1 Tax=Sinimarinibacterium sp. CAU 1509 TaxID=2562283 RepID=UPI0010AC8E2C|nr:CsiV family protein [Sinimarinibacterium sp. CAU 1509]TJY63051.1 hypothetical protein E4T66_04900 [Sinimarinibacterium sp. CAU 1509]
MITSLRRLFSAPNRVAAARNRGLLPVALVLALLSGPALAEDYRVDLIVFLDSANAGEAGTAPRAVGLNGISLDDAAALASAGIRVLPESDFALQEQWNRLRNASRFKPMIRLAWIQRDPPSAQGPALHLRYGQPLAVVGADGGALYPVDGIVRLLMNRYLHLDAELQYTAVGSSGNPVSYRLDEKRRMRRDEIHHMDSPKLGILARVSK